MITLMKSQNNRRKQLSLISINKFKIDSIVNRYFTMSILKTKLSIKLNLMIHKQMINSALMKL